ncbi:uncharacterized protein EV420DRAFT_1749758 [Desarmillaria tabescens]|uniref:Secreted protein n=1 Tax=Armillaria tabescens TaxID=1929756 RepID=A0AA39N010_ARMTA|nr:uncharacterized protein EV420DRAFT_1749758 [Desarmillaria tabescens]KAK0452957.1 hypothetical protein EV420DRAFT_1749758 [Desarmillaria tabescens]
MKLLILTLISISLVSAASISSRATQASNIGMVYCTEANFTGICAHATIGAGTCVTFVPGDTFYKTISSVQNDPENICTIYPGVQCVGASLDINQGYNDLSTVGWDNTARPTSAVGPFLEAPYLAVLVDLGSFCTTLYWCHRGLPTLVFAKYLHFIKYDHQLSVSGWT